MTTTAAAPGTATSRHRLDGSVPVGNSSSMNAIAKTIGTKIHSDAAPTIVGARSPSPPEIAATAYADVAPSRAIPAATPARIQPIGLAARRTINDPSAM